MALTDEEFAFYQWEIEMTRGDSEGIFDPLCLQATETIARIIDQAIALEKAAGNLDIPLPPRPDEEE